MKKLKQKITDKLGEKKTATLKRVLKVGRIVKNIVCWILIAVLTVAVIIFMFNRVSGETPKVFGYSLHRIISGSMVPELAIGDVIISKEVKSPSEIGIGDIITFQGDRRFENQKVTHRVLVAPYDDGRGNTVLVTKGDANETDDGEISFSDVESKYLTKFSFLKSIYNFFFSPWGLLIFIFLLLLIFFDEILNIIRLTVSAEDHEELPNEVIVTKILEEKKAAQAKEPDDSGEGSVQEENSKSEASVDPETQPSESHTDEENTEPEASTESENQPDDE